MPIHEAETGLRHFGHFTAHSENRCLEILRDSLADQRKLLEASDALCMSLKTLLDQAQRERDEARRIVTEMWEMFYGQNLRLENWHKNGDLEPIDRFFESNNWNIEEPTHAD